MKMPNGDVSELTYTDSAARRIITMDESHHPLTTETDRGGSRSISYGDNNDNRGRSKSIQRITRVCHH